MHIRPTFLRSTLTLGAALLGLAPAAAAQTPEPVVGDPIAYRVQMPAGARIERDGYLMTAETDNAYVVVAAVDLVEEAPQRLPVSDREARRIMTDVFMGSDSLLLGLLDEGMRQRDVRLVGLVREFRTLGGQRAAYLRGRIAPARDAPSVEAYITVKDGVMYMLMFTAVGPRARTETLAAQVHQSFVLADAPPPAEPQTGRTDLIRRIKGSQVNR